ncbi:MAG: protein-glutamate O-methyltransferase CheR [Bacillota bacterium]|jgi:chemotaxis protein methyltransferase CheR
MIAIKTKEFLEIVKYVKGYCGLDLTEKRHLVEGRLQNMLAQLGMESFGEYFKYVTADKTGRAVVDLLNKVTTNHTFFLREKDHFHFFQDKVLPYLATTVTNKDLRIWSAGCATGEEPYTLAIIIAEYFKKQKYLWDSKILATDISRKALQTATAATYNVEQVGVLPEAWKKNYFHKIGPDSYTVAEKIRNEVVFRVFNLIDSVFPFKQKFQVIFCRNVMIYFDMPTKQELIRKFYDITEPGGYLFIGHAESINRDTTRYKYMMPAIYRKE